MKNKKLYKKCSFFICKKNIRKKFGIINIYLIRERIYNKMMVGDILTITGGNTNFYIQGTTEDDKIIQLAYGKVDDIKFPSVPYGKYEVEHMTVDGNFLYLIIDTSTHFANVNIEFTDINNKEFFGY